MMNNPNYVLKANENILVPKNENLNSLKIPVMIIIGLIIIGSLLFQDNLFLEISWAPRILLIVLVINVFLVGGRKREPSPIELHFYDEYLVIYRPKRYYDKKTIRMEFNKFYYKDIHQCVFKSRSQQIKIYGILNAEWFNYNKDGSLPSKPTVVRSADSLLHFRTSASLDVDFVSEIEKHSPIKVEVSES